KDVTGIGHELAIDAVEASRLACTVRSDERDQLACGDRERHVVDGAHAAELLAQVFDAQGAHRRTRRARAPPNPIGNASTMTRISTPSAARQYCVLRASASASQVNAAAPSSGPNSALMPPSSTMTSASTERGMASVSGEMLPLENANSPPASPAKSPGI